MTERPEAHSDPPSTAPMTALPSFPDGLEPLRPLGQGKMARVYLAREPELDRLVAVKVVRPELASDETIRARFEREARAAASLAHPNVVAVHRFGRLSDGVPYLVMTYVQGRTLSDRLQADGPMAEGEARSLLVQLASALSAAHKKGFVHRDVNPGNVLVDEESGRYLLTDFGIAALLELRGGSSGGKLTSAGHILGDPRYISPEQLRGESVSGQADVYSLGVLAYEAISGEGPYQGRSNQDVLAAHLTGEPRPISRLRPGVSAELEDLLLRCLKREPAHRPRAQDIVQRLESRVPAERAPEGLDEGLGLKRRRIPQIVSGTFAAGVALIGLAVGAIDIGRLPPVTFELTLNFVIWGLLASGVLAWFHGERGKQEVPVAEKWILGALATGWIVATVVLLRR